MLTLVSSHPDLRVVLPHGASILFRTGRPTSGVVAARRAAGLAIEAGGDAADASVAFNIALAQWGALSWEGVGDEAGASVPLSPAGLEQLMMDWPEAYQAIDQGFVLPILERDAEKNASAPALPGGTPARARTAKSRSRGAVATSARPAKRPAPSAPIA